MYHLYHTNAFVLGSSPRGEGSRTFSLLTRELGLVSASATSVREERSKLRYCLQTFSLSRVTLVHGRELWRVTGATLVANIATAFRSMPDVTVMFGRIFRLLLRLLAGEEKNERLFDAVEGAFLFLQTIRTANEIRNYETANVEIVLVLRILFLLGYLAPRGEFGAVLTEPSLWDDNVVSHARSFRALALADINHALKASQL